MKKFARTILALAVVTPLIAGNVALAVDGAAASPTSTTPSTTSTPTTTTLTAQQKADLAKRLADRKTQLKIALTAAELSKYKTKCVGAQATINTLGVRVKGIETSRTQVYGNITDDLTKLSTKLKTKGLGTTTLDGEITTLKTKVTTFTTDLTSYKQDVADLKDMDCVADPTAFKASLDAARTAHDKVAKDAADIRTYLTATVKPTLKDLRTQLAAKTGSSTTTSTSTSTNTTTTGSTN